MSLLLLFSNIHKILSSMRERVLQGPIQFRCLLFHSVAKASVLLRELYYHVAWRQHDLFRHETNGYPLTGLHSFSFFTIRDFVDLSPETLNARDNSVTNMIACGFLQLVSNTRDACLENVKGNAGLSADFSPMPKCLSVYLKMKFWITGVDIRKRAPDPAHFCFPCSSYMRVSTVVKLSFYEF